MSCPTRPATFRLLDGLVGWDVHDGTGLEGLDSVAGGVTLARLTPHAVSPAELLPFLPPAQLAAGCGKCAWYLVTPPPSRLLRLVCGADPEPCQPRPPCGLSFVAVPCLDAAVDAVAVAARRHLVALSDAGAGEVRVHGASGQERLAVIPVADAGPLAFTPWGELLVSTGGHHPGLFRYAIGGEPLGRWRAPLPAGTHAIDRLGVGSDCTLWIVARDADGTLSLWRATREAPEFVRAGPADLSGSFAPTMLVVAGEEGFCLRDGPLGPTCCFDWYGHPASAPPPMPAVARARQGQLLTTAIDSGTARCRWHRVRLEATVPPGTSLDVAVATSELQHPPPQGEPHHDPGWETFPAGVPHPADWDAAPQGALDYLVRQPPGRYLHLRLRLRGDGASTPIVHRVRLDFPRLTSLEHLPPIYREEPQAEDFTERFLSLFDASVGGLDRAIERLPAMLDASAVPDAVLPWLARFLDLALEPSWDASRRRALIVALPALYRQRGTRAGLSEIVRLVFDVEPVIEELASERAWGAIGRDAQLGGVRLFSRARARLTLGASALGSAPLRSVGNPDLDPLTGPAWRLRVLIPTPGGAPRDLELRLARLLEAQKPAHTVVSTRVGGRGFVVGSWAAAGVDTLLAPLPAPVLGGPQGNTRLSRGTVLWPRRAGSRGAFAVGLSAGVGVHTMSA
jgi:phage tail-like protein